MTTFEETKSLLNESSFYYIVSINMEGRYSYVNNHYQNRFMYVHGNMVGQPYHITMPEEDRGICGEVAAKCFEDPGRTYPATIRKHDGSGGYVVTQWEYKAMLDSDGRPAGIFCIGHDVTEYLNGRSELEGAKLEIGKKDDIIEGIAFNQSHVIRRPLANIMGLSLILQNMEMDQNLRNICDMLIESSHQLDEAIRDSANRINSVYRTLPNK